MSAAHTPGPWRVDQFGSQDKWAVGPDVSHRVCDVYGEANACLITAAPDLLDALQALVGGLKAAGFSTSHADAAIAKATGAQP